MRWQGFVFLYEVCLYVCMFVCMLRWMDGVVGTGDLSGNLAGERVSEVVELLQDS